MRSLRVVKYLLALLFIGLTIHSFSQAVVETTFYSKEAREVSSREESFFYVKKYQRLINGDTILSFYTKQDKIRSLTVVNRSGQGEGVFKHYHENGVLKAEGTKINGAIVGDLVSYYPSGKVQAVESYGFTDIEPKLITYNDSSGVTLVKNGNGYCEGYFGSYGWYHPYMEKGKVVDGVRDSIWSGYKDKSQLYFHDTYSKGKFMKGVSFDSLGNSYDYQVIQTQASPECGLQEFYTRVVKVVKYPEGARRLEVEGKVFVGFVVDKDGSVIDIQTVKGIGHGCNEEAEKSLQACSTVNWTPGRFRGQLIKQQMVLPVIFKLQ